MNWYARYAGDYMQDTAHLSLAEHGAYTMMLDHYYGSEKPLPDDATALYRICRAFSEDEQAAVVSVADQFFPVGEDGKRHNKRADKELDKRQAISQKRRVAGAKGASSKWDGKQMANATTPTATSTDTDTPTDTSTEDTPHSPPKGTRKKSGRVSENTPLMTRIGSWFGRRPDTLWTRDEAQRLNRLQLDDRPEEVDGMESYYTADMPGDSDYRRHDVKTLLNNWTGELDRARTHYREKNQGPAMPGLEI